MVDYYLKDLTTEHPGGWEDIIGFVNSNFDRYQATYKIVEASGEKVLRSFSSTSQNAKGESKADLIIHSKEIEATLPRLENIHHQIPGIAASMGWAVLRALGLPVPGHSAWKKPCSQWSKP